MMSYCHLPTLSKFKSWLQNKVFSSHLEAFAISGMICISFFLCYYFTSLFYAPFVQFIHCMHRILLWHSAFNKLIDSLISILWLTGHH